MLFPEGLDSPVDVDSGAQQLWQFPESEEDRFLTLHERLALRELENKEIVGILQWHWNEWTCVLLL